MGGVTDTKPHDSVIKLDFLDKGRQYEAIIYADGKTADYKTNPQSYTITKKTVKQGDVLKLVEAPGGGVAIMIKAI